MEKLEGILNASSVQYRIFRTEKPGHATEIAADLAGDEEIIAVVSVGGDGTAGEIAAGLTGTGKPMGIIPAGTGNDFIKSAGIPNDPDKALEKLLGGKAGRIDTGTVNDQFFLLVVNAANKDKDYKWICDHQSGDVTIEDISAQVGQIALQGPKAMTILKKLVKEADIPAEYYAATYNVDLCGSNVMISTTGYTGEEGVEIYMPWEDAPKIWEALMEAGADEGLIPCGLGARDTLRLEAGMPLYGHEMDDTITPKEALLSMFVKMDKDDFIGKAAIEAKTPPARKKVGLEVIGRGIIREHMDVYKGDKKIGVTTSGTMCPYLKKAMAVALVESDERNLGDEVEVDVRGRRVKAKMVKAMFYQREQ